MINGFGNLNLESNRNNMNKHEIIPSSIPNLTNMEQSNLLFESTKDIQLLKLKENLHEEELNRSK